MSKYFSLIKVLILTVLMFGCSGGSSDPPRWDLYQSVKKPSATSEPIPATDNLVVYLDTSASMAGYVSPNGNTTFASASDGNTIFSKTLLELRNVVTTLSPQPQPVVRTVDTSVSAPSFSDLDLSKAALTRSIYAGRETNLAGAIRAFDEPLDPDAEVKTPPRFHILVTDGVQSSDKNNSDVSCAQGSDSFCVKKQLLELVNKGWGGAVIGMKSEFDGNVYSEIAHKAVPFSSEKNVAKFRPFYLYIFSPDRAALDKLTESLLQKLAPLGREDLLRQYPLTSDYTNGAAVVEINQDKSTKDFLEVRQETAKETGISRLTVKSDLDTESKGEQQFILTVKPAWTNHALAAGDLANLIKWEIKQIFPEKEANGLRYPNFKLVKQEAKNGSVELTFQTGWTKSPGDTAWRMFQIVGRLDTEKNSPPWVAAWTTNLDTTVEQANKTLNIESSLANLWKNAALENYPVAEICVRVGEK